MTSYKKIRVAYLTNHNVMWDHRVQVWVQGFAREFPSQLLLYFSVLLGKCKFAK